MYAWVIRKELYRYQKVGQQLKLRLTMVSQLQLLKSQVSVYGSEIDNALLSVDKLKTFIYDHNQQS